MSSFIVDLEVVKINEMEIPHEGAEGDDALEEASPEILEAMQEMKPGLHLLIEVKLGEESFHLVVDTGASKSVFDPVVTADYLELMQDKLPISSAGVGSKLDVGFGRLCSFTLGELYFDKLLVGLTSLDSVNRIYSVLTGKTIAGLLGSDFLMEYRAVIDYEKQTMKLQTMKV